MSITTSDLHVIYWHKFFFFHFGVIQKAILHVLQQPYMLLLCIVYAMMKIHYQNCPGLEQNDHTYIRIKLCVIFLQVSITDFVHLWAVTTTTLSVIISPVPNPESPSSKWNEAPACLCIKTLTRWTEPSGVHSPWRAPFSSGWIAWITWIGTFSTSSIWWVRCWSLWISAAFSVIIISTITEPSPGRNHLHAFTLTCTRVDILKLIAEPT